MPRVSRPAGARAQVRMQVQEVPGQMPRRGSSDGTGRISARPAAKKPRVFDDYLAETARGQVFTENQLGGDSSVAANLLRFRRKPRE